MRQQTFDYDISSLSIEAERDYDNNKPKELVGAKVLKRNELFFGRRYAQGTYKAIKAGISRPSVMMKFCGDKFRLYGQPENNKLFDKAKQILSSWKARNKADMRAYKLYVKAHKDNHVSFEEWINGQNNDYSKNAN